MIELRKCCETPKGKGPHAGGCPNGFNVNRILPRGEPLVVMFDKAHIPKEVRIEILEETYGDLPDGAFWAMAEEFGLDPSDF